MTSNFACFLSNTWTPLSYYHERRIKNGLHLHFLQKSTLPKDNLTPRAFLLSSLKWPPWGLIWIFWGPKGHLIWQIRRICQPAKNLGVHSRAWYPNLYVHMPILQKGHTDLACWNDAKFFISESRQRSLNFFMGNDEHLNYFAVPWKAYEKRSSCSSWGQSVTISRNNGQMVTLNLQSSELPARLLAIIT